MTNGFTSAFLQRRRPFSGRTGGNVLTDAYGGRTGAGNTDLTYLCHWEGARVYVDYLGYGVDWEHRFEPTLPLYTQVSRDASILHLSEHHGDGSPGQHLRVVVQDVAAFHHELSVKDYGYMKPGLQTAEWGERSVTVIDPFGNHLICYEKTVSE